MLWIGVPPMVRSNKASRILRWPNGRHQKNIYRCRLAGREQASQTHGKMHVFKPKWRSRPRRQGKRRSRTRSPKGAGSGSRLLRTATDIRRISALRLCVGCVLVAHDASQKASVGWVKARSAVPTRRRFGSPRGLRGACHRGGHFGPDPLAQPTLYSSLRRRLTLDIRPSISYMTIVESRSSKGAFRMRSRCGASAVPARGLANRSGRLWATARPA